MARLVGPDEGSRLAYGIRADNTLTTGGGLPVTVYADAGATTLADILTHPGGVVVPGSVLSVGASSLLPLFQFPDGVDVVYVSANGGPVSPVYARNHERLDAAQATANAAETPAGATAKANAAQAAAIAAVAATGPLRAVDGRNYRMILGVIRNNGSGSGYWQAIDDGFHRPHNIDSVTTDTSSIVVNFASLGGTRVVSLVVFPDETLAAAGIMAGASVTAAAATITLSRPAALADYVFYNGTSWVSQSGIFTGLSFAAGVLSLTHPSMEDPANPFVTFYGVSVTGRGSALVPLISTDSGGVSNTALKVSWFDWAGTMQTTATTNMKAFITRSAPKAQTVNPQTVDTTKFPSSNLWIIGVVEV